MTGERGTVKNFHIFKVSPEGEAFSGGVSDGGQGPVCWPVLEFWGTRQDNLGYPIWSCLLQRLLTCSLEPGMYKH